MECRGGGRAKPVRGTPSAGGSGKLLACARMPKARQAKEARETGTGKKKTKRASTGK